jgi:hypothetical protein
MYKDISRAKIMARSYLGMEYQRPKNVDQKNSKENIRESYGILERFIHTIKHIKR